MLKFVQRAVHAWKLHRRTCALGTALRCCIMTLLVPLFHRIVELMHASGV